ncbi:MAG: hypothetical protein ACM3X6_05150 [Patescibacteria group bacterium]
MARCKRLSAAICLALALLFCRPAACLAHDVLELLAGYSGEELELKLHGEFVLWSAAPWSLQTNFTMQSPLAGDNEDYAGCTLTWKGVDWRFTGSAKYTLTPSEDHAYVSLRGAYIRDPWNLSVTLYRERELDGEDGTLSLEGHAAYRLGGHWRLSLDQGYAQVVCYDGHRRYTEYTAEARTTWYGDGEWYRLSLGGRTKWYEDAQDDTATLYTILACRLSLGERWDLNGQIRAELYDDNADTDDEEDYDSRLSLTLSRRAPLGLRLQGSYALAGEELRAGLTLLGTLGSISWQAGVAGEAELYYDSWKIWCFALLYWRSGAWQIRLGLAPEGAYAETSRHGYWVEVAYVF